MGLISAAIGSAGGVLADQWKEFFSCESLPNDVLMCKGQKQIGNRSSNKKGSDNIITNGSGIVVADGQCMIIVDQGQVVEVCAEAGQFTYDASSEPTIFSGKFGDSLLESFKTVGRRFTYGGSTGKDQRVYYFNTKEILGNKFGTANPIPFRVVDARLNLDIDLSVRCNGTYTFRISDPLLFYKSIAGNVSDMYTKDQIESQLKTEFVAALQPAFGKLSEMQIRPNQLVSHNKEIQELVNEELSVDWGTRRGLKVENVAIGSVTLPEEDQQLLKEAQRNAMYLDPSMGAAATIGAQTEAMKAAASNPNGAMTGFMGMGMAMNAGGMNAQNLYAMGAERQQQQAAAAPACDTWTCSCGATAKGKFCPECGAKKPAPAQADGWTCKCGATAKGKFCPECGSPKPTDDGWTCSCGSVNKGKFCQNCGSPKPAGAPLYRCDKCGWEPEDPKNPPKFCPECGDIFDENDKQ